MDTALTYLLHGEMDIDYQDYRSVVVYVNGEYYGLYNIRERLNGDYLKTRNIETNNGIKQISYEEILNLLNTNSIKLKYKHEYTKKIVKKHQK